jgi:hypothetical protein
MWASMGQSRPTLASSSSIDEKDVLCDDEACIALSSCAQFAKLCKAVGTDLFGTQQELVVPLIAFEVACSVKQVA